MRFEITLARIDHHTDQGGILFHIISVRLNTVYILRSRALLSYRAHSSLPLPVSSADAKEAQIVMDKISTFQNIYLRQ